MVELRVGVIGSGVVGEATGKSFHNFGHHVVFNDIDEKKLSIFIGPYKIFFKGSLYEKYDEKKVSEYMKNESVEITIEIGMGNKNFTAYTMDLTKKYIEINADYKVKLLLNKERF